ncbi:MAG: hypothetical protein U9R38_06055 [Candidatus Margulisiibacteriota bacterium]|nr:hypothetical protein [Candidatus Margulisiibacteriota bacterium]
MKKLLSLLLVLGLGIALISGCSSTSSSGGDTTIPADTVAGGVGVAASNSLTVDNAAGSAAGISGFSTAVAPPMASAITLSRSADGWFEGSDNYSAGGFTYTRTFAFKIYDTNGEVTTILGLAGLTSADVTKMIMAVTIEYTFSGGSYAISFGTSKTDPMTFTYSPTKSIDGPIQYTSTYSGDDFTITYDYGTLTVGASGYPSGDISWSVSSSGSTVAAGTLVFDGTSVAVLTITSGGSGTYNVDLTDGSVVAAGL